MPNPRGRPPRQQPDDRKSVLVRLSPENYAIIKAAAALKGISVQQLVEPVVTAWIADELSGHPALAQFFGAQALMAVTDESEVSVLRPRSSDDAAG